MNQQTLAIDLLNPSAEYEKRQHKLKRLVQSPNSYFMDVKCPGVSLSLSPRLSVEITTSAVNHGIKNSCLPHFPGCFAITTVFSHAQTVVLCSSCASVLCQPTGGKARLTEGKPFLPNLVSYSRFNPCIQEARSVERTRLYLPCLTTIYTGFPAPSRYRHVAFPFHPSPANTDPSARDYSYICSCIFETIFKKCNCCLRGWRMLFQLQPFV